MNESGPKNTKDDDLDIFIKNPEDQERIVSILKKEIETMLLSSRLQDKFMTSDIDVFDFDSIDEYLAAFKKAHPELKRELNIWVELWHQKTVADIRKFCKLKNIKINIREIIEREEINKTLKREEIN